MLTSIISSQSSTRRSSSGEMGITPALLTSTSSLPYRSLASLTRAATSSGEQERCRFAATGGADAWLERVSTTRMSAGRAITNRSFRMLTEQTIDRLRTLRLGAIADAYLAQQRDPSAASLSFDERLGMLVDAEQLARDNRALTRRLKEAKLRLSYACLEDLDYSGRKLDRALIRQ